MYEVTSITWKRILTQTESCILRSSTFINSRVWHFEQFKKIFLSINILTKSLWPIFTQDCVNLVEIEVWWKFNKPTLFA